MTSARKVKCQSSSGKTNILPSNNGGKNQKSNIDQRIKIKLQVKPEFMVKNAKSSKIVSLPDYTLPKKLDKSVISEAIDFFSTRKMLNLPLTDPFIGVGVYGIFYFGDSPIYKRLTEKNEKMKDNDKIFPIYVGQAAPAGTRTARPHSSKVKTLFNRINQHSTSIQYAKNLDIADFKCKFVILQEYDIDLLSPLESELFRHYKPIWNSCISGFGIHTPGEGRNKQQRSEWDTIHPGRPYADGLPDNKKWTKTQLYQEIDKFIENL
jgi:hypothetical protein